MQTEVKSKEQLIKELPETLDILFSYVTPPEDEEDEITPDSSHAIELRELLELIAEPDELPQGCWARIIHLDCAFRDILKSSEEDIPPDSAVLHLCREGIAPVFGAAIFDPDPINARSIAWHVLRMGEGGLPKEESRAFTHAIEFTEALYVGGDGIHTLDWILQGAQTLREGAVNPDYFEFIQEDLIPTLVRINQTLVTFKFKLDEVTNSLFYRVLYDIVNDLQNLMWEVEDLLGPYFINDEGKEDNPITYTGQIGDSLEDILQALEPAL